MKRLLSILAAVIVGGSPIAITGFHYANYYSARKITEQAAIDSYNRIVKLLITTVTSTKCSCTGNTTQCNDGSWSNSAGSGTCSHHGGVK